MDRVLESPVAMPSHLRLRPTVTVATSALRRVACLVRTNLGVDIHFSLELQGLQNGATPILWPENLMVCQTCSCLFRGRPGGASEITCPNKCVDNPSLPTRIHNGLYNLEAEAWAVLMERADVDLLSVAMDSEVLVSRLLQLSLGLSVLASTLYAGVTEETEKALTNIFVDSVFAMEKGVAHEPWRDLIEATKAAHKTFTRGYEKDHWLRDQKNLHERINKS